MGLFISVFKALCRDAICCQREHFVVFFCGAQYLTTPTANKLVTCLSPWQSAVVHPARNLHMKQLIDLKSWINACVETCMIEAMVRDYSQLHSIARVIEQKNLCVRMSLNHCQNTKLHHLKRMSLCRIILLLIVAQVSRDNPSSLPNCFSSFSLTDSTPVSLRVIST